MRPPANDDAPVPSAADLVPVRAPLKDIDTRRWPAHRLAAFEYLEPAALCLVATDGPVSVTLRARDGTTRHIGHNIGVWPAKVTKTSQLRDTVTANYNKGIFFLGAQWRVWFLTKADRDKLGRAVTELIADRAETHGGPDELINGFEDLGPDLDMPMFEMEVHGMAERFGMPHFDDEGLELFLDRVSWRVTQKTGGKPVRDLRRLYEQAALQEAGR